MWPKTNGIPSGARQLILDPVVAHVVTAQGPHATALGWAILGAARFDERDDLVERKLGLAKSSASRRALVIDTFVDVFPTRHHAHRRIDALARAGGAQPQVRRRWGCSRACSIPSISRP